MVINESTWEQELLSSVICMAIVVGCCSGCCTRQSCLVLDVVASNFSIKVTNRYDYNKEIQFVAELCYKI